MKQLLLSSSRRVYIEKFFDNINDNIVAAAERGDLDTVTSFVASEEFFQQAGFENLLSLAHLFACSNGNLELVRLLYSEGAKTQYVDIGGAVFSGLYEACLREHVEVVRFLLSNGVDFAVDASKEHDVEINPYAPCCILEDNHLVPIANEAELEVRENEYFQPILTFVAGLGNVDILNQCLCHVKPSDSYCSDALLAAIRCDQFEVVKRLINFGVDINRKDRDEYGEAYTPLIYTIGDMNVDLMIYFLQQSSPSDAVRAEWVQALLFSPELGQSHINKLLDAWPELQNNEAFMRYALMQPRQHTITESNASYKEIFSSEKGSKKRAAEMISRESVSTGNTQDERASTPSQPNAIDKRRKF